MSVEREWVWEVCQGGKVLATGETVAAAKKAYPLAKSAYWRTNNKGTPYEYYSVVNGDPSLVIRRTLRNSGSVLPERACVMVFAIGGVNERVFHGNEASLIERLNRWLPELRQGRVALQDFGYKKGVVSEDGTRSYEIFVL